MTAIRNARRAGLPRTEQASLADQALYAHFGGEQFVSTLLLEADLATGRVRAVDAGSPLVARQRGEAVEPVPMDPQLSLGMFEGTIYEVEEFALEEGDRLTLLSDGLQIAESPTGAAFGEADLEKALRATRDLSTGEAVRQVIHTVVDHGEGRDLRDDALVVCLD